jgi:hypothetical protein
MMRAQTKTKAPMQLPITVLTGIEFEPALVVCVEEGEAGSVAIIVNKGAVREGPDDAPLSIAKAEVATAVLLSMTAPEIPEPLGMDVGSILFARYRPSLTNMMNVGQRRSGLKVGKDKEGRGCDLTALGQ